MATHSFVLKEPGANADTIIFLIVRDGNKRLKYSTGEKVSPSKWDKAKQRVNLKADGVTNSDKAVNNQLERYVDALDKLVSNVTLNKLPFDLGLVRLYLDREFTHKQAKAAQTLLEFADGYQKMATKKPGTRANYVTTIGTLREYEVHRRKGRPLGFADIGLDFYLDFVKYCQEVKKMALNTVGARVKNIKVFMEVARQKGLHDNLAYKGKGFKVMKEEVDSVYLTEDELAKIYGLDLSGDGKLDGVRDVFMVGCRTGLRFGDLKQLTPDKIIKAGWGDVIRIRTQKTGEVVYVPLHDQTVEIFKKHGGKLPRVPSNQEFNRWVKELAQMAGITHEVATTRTQAGASRETLRRKCQLVTAHTARRTFATLAYKAKVPVQSIMKITGHSTEKVFQSYLKLGSEDHAEIMQQHEYFRPKLKVVG
jgi:integrase